MAKKVYIAVGHGGADAGAVANGLLEKDLNLVTALACRDELVRHGVNVKIDRTTDVELTMSETVNACNAFAPDLAADIHHNAGGGDGAEVFYSVHGGEGKKLAENILEEIKVIGQNSRGAKTRESSNGSDYYGFIRGTDSPAVIVECAFIDNKTDVKIVDTKPEQQTMGKAIAKGILKTLGIAYKEEIDEMTEAEIKKLIQAEAKKIAKAEVAKVFDMNGTGNNPAAWAKKACEYCVERGIFTGDGKGNYGWQKAITREQAAAIIYKLSK